MSSRKAKGFFTHPKLVHTKQEGPLSSPKKATQEEIEQTKARLVKLKTEQIEQKRAKLEALRLENAQLEETARNYESTTQSERERLLQQQALVDDKLAEVDAEIAASNELEKLEVGEYIEWRHSIAKEKHFERVEELRKKYSEENTLKMEKINDLNRQIQSARDDLREAQEQRKNQSEIVVEQEEEEEVVMPNLRGIGAEVSFLRDKIKSLRENKKIIVTELKEQLTSGSWSVKDTFDACKDRISKEIKKLLHYLEKPQKQVIKASTEKVPNPLSLIEAYEARLSALQDKLPEELRTQQILKCLRPLPWRSIKGSGIDPSTSATAEIHDKFNRLQKEFVEAQQRNKQLKQSLRDKDAEIDRLMLTLKELEERSKQLRK